MPHLTIEYSPNLGDFPEADMALALNASVCASPEVKDESDLKTRFVRTRHFQIGTADTSRAFVHAQLRLLAGRSPKAKQDLSERIAAVLRRMGPRPDGTLVQLSVEIVDMDRPSYVKESLG